MNLHRTGGNTHLIWIVNPWEHLHNVYNKLDIAFCFVFVSICFKANAKQGYNASAETPPTAGCWAIGPSHPDCARDTWYLPEFLPSFEQMHGWLIPTPQSGQWKPQSKKAKRKVECIEVFRDCQWKFDSPVEKNRILPMSITCDITHFLKELSF